MSGRDFNDDLCDFGGEAVRVALGAASFPDDADLADRYLSWNTVPLGHPIDATSSVSATPQGVSLADFRAYMPTHQYIFIPTGELWPATSVNSRIPPVMAINSVGQQALDDHGKPKKINASTWLDQERAVEQMTWVPGEEKIIDGWLTSEGGWISRPGCACFNLYRPPAISRGNPDGAVRWVEHVERVYPAEAKHIIQWLAHRVQRPEEKVNHALVLGGAQGIGKDTLLEPVKVAIGPWNFAEVSPQHLLGRFNGFVKSVILRVSEARDLGDVDRFAFYDHMKTYTAAPPDVLRVDEKHMREYNVFNVCGVILTSNHKTDGIFLPADDRRHFVAWSDCNRDDFANGYWNDLYAWYHAGGLNDVGAYLRTLDLSDFDAKAPPPKTEAFWAVVDSNRSPEDAEMADALERLSNPSATSLSALASSASEEFRGWLQDRRNSRKVPHRLEECGYEPIRNPSAKDGLWKFSTGRAAVYARKELSLRDRLGAAEELISNTFQRP